MREPWGSAGADPDHHRQPQRVRHQAPGADGGHGGPDHGHRRRRRDLPEPARLRDALCRTGAFRHQPDRHGAGRGRHRLRRRLGRHQRAGGDRQHRPRPHAAGREGPAQQRQCRLRAFRQCRLARPDFLHAADHPRTGPRRRDFANHTIAGRRQGRARAYRHVGARQLPPRGTAAFGFRRHPLRRRRRRAHGRVDPPSRCRRRARPRRREGDGARFRRQTSGCRRRSLQHQRRARPRCRADRRSPDRGQYPARADALSRAPTISAPASRPT